MITVKALMNIEYKREIHAPGTTFDIPEDLYERIKNGVEFIEKRPSNSPETEEKEEGNSNALDEEENSSEAQYIDKDLEKLTIADLQAILDEKGVEYTTKLNKNEYIQLVKEN